MQRTLTREDSLPAFTCDIDAFETLIVELSRLVGDAPNVRIAVTIGGLRASESLSFESVAELREAGLHERSLKRANVRIASKYPNSDRRVVSVYSSGMLPLPRLTVESDDLAWNAGAVEVILAFANRHRRWFGKLWVVREAVLVALPLALILMALHRWAHPSPAIESISATACAVIFLSMTAVSPGVGMEIVLRPSGPRIFGHKEALALVLSGLAVIGTFLGWLFPRR